MDKKTCAISKIICKSLLKPVVADQELGNGDWVDGGDEEIGEANHYDLFLSSLPLSLFPLPKEDIICSRLRDRIECWQTELGSTLLELSVAELWNAPWLTDKYYFVGWVVACFCVAVQRVRAASQLETIQHHCGLC